VNAAPSLLSIIAYARSGALEHASRLFSEAGFDRITDDPAVLSVRGRLLKDRAAAAPKKDRGRIWLEAARAYERAGRISGANYPLINAATLSLLGGRPARARSLARKVLENKTEEAETLYWRAATLAEAELLIGNVGRAREKLEEAIMLAPEAFEDHASTLRQFGRILDERGEVGDWLDPLRPPRSLHYAGHMDVSHASEAIGRNIHEFLERERIGFAYGALAAGADIRIAEAVLEFGAELHVVLPVQVPEFRRASVDRFGSHWRTRFDRVLERASTVRVAGDGSDGMSPLTIRLAGVVAMGDAVMQAETLTTEAVQLLILESGDRFEDLGLSGAIGKAWRNAGHRQHVLTARRAGARAGGARRQSHGKRAERLAAILRLDPGSLGKGWATGELARLKKILSAAEGQIAPPLWTGEAVVAGFAEPFAAAKAAIAAAAMFKNGQTIRIAGHYGVVQMAKDPFASRPYLAGAAVSLPARIMLSTPLGAIHVSEDFAAALCATTGKTRPRSEYIGELPASGPGDPLRLFSIKPG
jgi:hypothetical protein